MLHRGAKDCAHLTPVQEEYQVTRLSAPLALAACAIAPVISLIVQPAIAQETHRVGEMTLTSEDAAEIYTKSYSPYGGRGFPTEARHLSIEGFGVGVALRDGKVSHRVHAGPRGERILALSPDGFQKLETAVSSSLDRLFNAP